MVAAYPRRRKVLATPSSPVGNGSCPVTGYNATGRRCHPPVTRRRRHSPTLSRNSGLVVSVPLVDPVTVDAEGSHDGPAAVVAGFVAVQPAAGHPASVHAHALVETGQLHGPGAGRVRRESDTHRAAHKNILAGAAADDETRG